jgi:hypothetical protein
MEEISNKKYQAPPADVCGHCKGKRIIIEHYIDHNGKRAWSTQCEFCNLNISEYLLEEWKYEYINWRG